MKDMAPCRSPARIPFSAWMFLKTFSAGWSSGDCGGVVCATASRQEINAVTKSRKAIALVAPEHPRARCWSFKSPYPSRRQECARLRPFLHSVLSNRRATETQHIWGETVSRRDQTDRTKDLSWKDYPVPCRLNSVHTQGLILFFIPVVVIAVTRFEQRRLTTLVRYQPELFRLRTRHF